MSGTGEDGVRFAAPLDLADPRLERLIVRLAVPSVAGLSITALHHVANAAFVGLLSGQALAAVSIAVPIFALVAAIGHGLGIGGAASIGRLLGAGEAFDAGRAASATLALCVLLGGAAGIGLFWGAGGVLALFSPGPDLAPIAATYLRLLAVSCPLLLAQIACDFIAIAEGNSRFSMWTLLGAFALNIVLDPLLIFGFGLGVEGAALATILSQLAALAAYGLYFRCRWGRVRLGVGRLGFRTRLLRPILAVGVPAGLSSALSALAFAVVYAMAGIHGGDEAVAGVSIAFRLLTLGLLPVIGFCLGAQPVLSFAAGAGDRIRLRAATLFMARVALGFTLVYAVSMMLWSAPLAGLFTTDARVADVARRGLILFHAGFALTGLHQVLVILLQAMERARLAAVISLAPQGYLLLPLLYGGAALWGMDGVLAAPLLAMGLTALVSAALLLREVRRLPTARSRKSSPSLVAEGAGGSA